MNYAKVVFNQPHTSVLTKKVEQASFRFSLLCNYEIGNEVGSTLIVVNTVKYENYFQSSFIRSKCGPFFENARNNENIAVSITNNGSPMWLDWWQNLCGWCQVNHWSLTNQQFSSKQTSIFDTKNSRPHIDHSLRRFVGEFHEWSRFESCYFSWFEN